MSDCIFCKIISGDIPSKKLYEDDTVLVFHDIQPKAPVHFLLIPKMHISGVSGVTAENSAIIAHIYEIISELTAELGLEHYRVITNNGEQAGQTVFHLHFHVLGGKLLGEMG